MESKKKGRRRSLRILSCITSSAGTGNDGRELEEVYGTVWLPNKELPDHTTLQQTSGSHQLATSADVSVSSQLTGCQTPISVDSVTSEQTLYTPELPQVCQPLQTFPTPEQLRRCQPQEDSFSTTPVHLSEGHLTRQVSDDADSCPKSSSFLLDLSRNNVDGPLDYSSPAADFLIQSSTFIDTNKSMCSVLSSDNKDSSILSLKEVLLQSKGLPSLQNVQPIDKSDTVPEHTMVSCADTVPNQTVVSRTNTVSNQTLVSCVKSTHFPAWSTPETSSRISYGKDNLLEDSHRDSFVQQQHHMDNSADQQSSHRDNYAEKQEHMDSCVEEQFHKDNCVVQDHERHGSKEQEVDNQRNIKRQTEELPVKPDSQTATHGAQAEISQQEAENVGLTTDATSSSNFPLLQKPFPASSVFSLSHAYKSIESCDGIETDDKLSDGGDIDTHENLPVMANIVKLQFYDYESDTSDSKQGVNSAALHTSGAPLTIKSKTEAAKAKKQRRRSAFGAELQLSLHAFQSQDELHSDITDKCSITSAHKIVEEFPKVQEAKSPTQSKVLASPCSQMEETKTASGSVHGAGDSIVDEACVKDRPVAEVGSGEQPSKVPKKKRKKRMSADISLTVSDQSSSQDLQNPQPPDSEPASSAFKRRRSSLRLYRNHSATSSLSGTNDQAQTRGFPSIPDSSSEKSDCVVKCNGSADSSDDLNKSENTISHELEQLYQNKNYKLPGEKTWETIFECPSKGKVTSKQKLKRFIQFTDNIPLFKLKRRVKKASQNGWYDSGKKLMHVDHEQVKQKLQQLDQEMLNST